MKKNTKYFILSFFVVLGIVLIIMGSSYSLFNYQVKGKTKNKITTGIYNSCEYENGTEWTFDYTGSEQTFTVPCDGEYKVELWGAQGGLTNNFTNFGGYTSGLSTFYKKNSLYIYVGSQGESSLSGTSQKIDNQFNGGGSSKGQSGFSDRFWGTGGGATDIRLLNGSWNDFQSLKSRIMVAAGGGGSIIKDDDSLSGGAAGGLVGISGINWDDNYGTGGTGGTQTSGGYTTCPEGSLCLNWDDYTVGKYGFGGFGYGGTSPQVGSSGGGSGYYGGGSSLHIQTAGGGSSFISGHNGCDAISINSTEGNIIHTGQPNHYSGYVFTDTKMIDGEGYNWTNEKDKYVGMPSHDGSTTMMGNSGNGYAKITLVKSKERYKEALLNGTDPVLEGSLVPVQISNNGTVMKANIFDKWYSYENKEWANAVILKDETKTYQNGETIPESNIESYFVWIPRYKYKIFDEGNYTGLTSIESKEQAIEVVFENKSITPSNGQTKGSYLTHPAFTSFDSNGMWVGKFETGYDGATTTAEAHVNSVAKDKVIIKPNVYSWRNITVGNAFKNSYDYIRELDSHMMKNTEWGAVAYLQHSIYGSATSVRINNNSAYITGYSSLTEPTIGNNSGTSIEGNGVESTSLGVDGTYTVNYQNSNSQVSSTTGNYTGIYDMLGGAWEYVMGYTTGANTVGGSSGITDLYSDFFNDTNYTKYWDKYTSTATTNYNNRILGDATGEMGPFESEVDPDNNSRCKSSWYKDFAHFANASGPWFTRGGLWDSGTGAGDFAFSNHTGGTASNIGYRIVLIPNP